MDLRADFVGFELDWLALQFQHCSFFCGLYDWHFGHIQFSAKRVDTGHVELNLTVPEGTRADVEVGNKMWTLGAGVYGFTVSVEPR